jgi:MshEN domain
MSEEDFDWSFPVEGSRSSVQESAILESLARRARPGERPEELLFDLGLLDEHDFALELAARSCRSYCGLRDFVPDPRLFVYLPVPIAVRERVCPLVLIGDSLKLASTFLDPDLSALDRRFPNLSVELGIAPRSEVLAALQRVTALL